MSLGKTPRRSREFVAKRALAFPVAMATDQMVEDFGGVRTLSTSFLVDREGRIRHEVTGIFTEPTFRMAVGRLLADPASVPDPEAGAR